MKLGNTTLQTYDKIIPAFAFNADSGHLCFLAQNEDNRLLMFYGLNETDYLLLRLNATDITELLTDNQIRSFLSHHQQELAIAHLDNKENTTSIHTLVDYLVAHETTLSNLLPSPNYVIKSDYVHHFNFHQIKEQGALLANQLQREERVDVCPYCHDYQGNEWSRDAYAHFVTRDDIRPEARVAIKFCQWCGRALKN